MALNPLLLVTLLVAVASAALPVFHEDAKDKVNNDEDDDDCRKTVTDDCRENVTDDDVVVGRQFCRQDGISSSEEEMPEITPTN